MSNTQTKKRSGNSNKNRNQNRPFKKRGPQPQRNRRKQSSVDINLLTQKAASQPVVEEFKASRTFNEMPLHPQLKSAIAKKGYKHPTEIQDRSLEALLEGRDIMGIAQTGTGKTGAFLIPIIHRLLENKRNFQTLVMVPTRELAVQVEEEFRSLSKGLGVYSACFIGGTNINRDLQNLRRKSHLVVGTPGRLLDLYQRRALQFRDFQVLVLDEFDRMLDMGFARDVNRITDAMTSRKHTMLFSATLDKQQQPYINKLLQNPVEVKVSSGEATGDHIEQEIIRLKEGEDKFGRLLSMVQNPEFEKVLVFAETKRWVNRVNKKLMKAGVKSDEIHGNKTQNYRQKALNKFKDGKVNVLVATDVAARGLDVSDITHVINYQLPGSIDSYIHRIGRTGRAGKKGRAFTFVN